jgi:hypothetical protein
LATQTRRLGAFANEAVLVTFDFDDVSMNILSLRVVNNTALPLTATITRTSDNRVYSSSFGPGTVVFNLPTGGGNAVTITDLGRGKYLGYSLSLVYPGGG